MSHWLRQTNQKLYQCRLLQEQQRQCGERVLQQALQESALYQLRDAWLCYLHELAEAASYRQPFSSLEQLLQQMPLVTGEVRELQQLAADPFSWLAQLLLAVERQMLPAAPAAAGHHRHHHDGHHHDHDHDDEHDHHHDEDAAAVPQAQRIDLIPLTAAEPAIDVAGWYRQLERLIDAQRGNRHES